MVVTEVKNHLVNNGQSRAEKVVATTAQMEDFVFDAIFLSCAGEQKQPSLELFSIRNGAEVKKVMVHEECDSIQHEGHGFSRRGVGMFACAKEEEEGSDDHISGGLEQFSIWLEVGCHKGNAF